MSVFKSGTSLNSRHLTNKNKISFGSSKKVTLKDKIVSSKFMDVQKFVPSYIQTNSKPNINSLIKMDYMKMWQEEHELYKNNVIKQKLLLTKKKPFKRPTFQSKNSAVRDISLQSTDGKINKVDAKNGLKILNAKPIWKI